MIPTSTKDPVRFTPSDIAPDTEKPPVYLIAVPSLRERAAFRRDVAASGVRFLNDKDLLVVLRSGIKEVVEEDAQAGLIERVDQFEADQEKPPQDRDTILLDDLTEIEKAITRNYPAYAEALADRGEWIAVAPIVACQHFLVGWENVDLTFARRAGKVPDSLMAQINEKHVIEIGSKAMSLLSPASADAKNSESRSPLPADRETLPADASQPTEEPAGSSSENSTQPIHDS